MDDAPKPKKSKNSNPAAELRKLIRLVSTSATAAIKLSSILGALIAIYYCMTIGFYPRGLTLGEAPFLLLTLMAFGFLSILGFGLGWLSALLPMAGLVWLKKVLLPPAKSRLDPDAPTPRRLR